jgi:hypothetical protein
MKKKLIFVAGSSVDPDPDPYQNVTDPQRCLLRAMKSHKQCEDGNVADPE